MTTPKIRIKKFNPLLLEERRLNGSPPTILVLGKRGTGKSTLVVDLLKSMKNIPMLLCMSGTEEGNNFYQSHIHPLCIHGDYKKTVVSNMIKQQRNKLMKCNKAGVDPNTRPDLGVGLLLDDCGYDKKTMKEPEIRLIFMNGRHWKITFIVALQYMMDITPDLRTNIDYIFVLRENIKANQERLYKYFFGCFQKFSHFQEAFIECTNNYECLVLDNTSKSNKIEDCVFWYKATPDLDYKIGSPELWSYLDSIYKKDYDDEEEQNQVKPVNSGIVVKKDLGS
jgi:hypothetical protein